jgi:hypothetical protein
VELLGGPTPDSLASATDAGTGAGETIGPSPLVWGPGTYWFRVTGADANDRAQMYDLQVSVDAAALPTIQCPPDQGAECGVPLPLDFAVTDPNGFQVDVVFEVDGVPEGSATLPAGPPPTSGTLSFVFAYSDGPHTVTATATNSIGGVAMCEFTVTAEDTLAPLVACGVLRRLLWTPANGLLDVGLVASASDICDGSPSVEVLVYSDEPPGSPPYAPDATLVGSTLKLRAERSTAAGADGRVYLVVVCARDDEGNTSYACCSVVVPLTITAARIAAVQAAGAAAEATFKATLLPPSGWSVILPATPLP